MFQKAVVCSIVVAASMYASGGSDKQPNQPPAPNTAELRISNEIAPPGGTVQMKYSFTNPQPIFAGGTSSGSYDLFGAALWSPLGDAAGVAVQHNGSVSVYAISPLSALGTGLDYPFLTLTMGVPSNLAAGTVSKIDLSSTSFASPSGQIAITTKPGSITAGSSLYINEVRPGGGTYPAGTVIRIEGQGFQPNASLQTPIKFSSFKVESSTEIQLVLKEETTLDAQPVQVRSGNTSVTFYSYLRGKPMQQPSKELLRSMDPMFQQITHALAQTGPLTAQEEDQYTAFALQNPNQGPAAVTLTLTHSDGSVSSNLIVMPSGARLVDELGALTGGAVQAGDVFNLVSTAPIQILGMNVDETAGTAMPFLPSF